MRNALTFAGFPAVADIDNLSADIAIIGIPHGTAYIPGKPSHSVNAPAAIRKITQRFAGMLDHFDFDLDGPLLNNSNIRIVDCGDVPGNPSDPAGNRRRATDHIRRILEAGAVPIVLGGDDSIPIPFFNAYRDHKQLSVIQVDAHIDWRDEVSGVTEGLSSTMRRASEMPWVERLIQVGMRGVGSARFEDVTAARDYGAEILTAKEIREGGVKRILNLVPAGTACLITIDCDGLDPSIMPAVNTPMPGGLLFHEVVELLHGLAKQCDIRGFDIVELAPEKDINGLGALTAARIVFNTIGSLIRSKFLI